MTKKDYVRIARIIKGNTHREIIDGTKKNEYSASVQKRGLINGLIYCFQEDNGLFNSEKFRAACQ